MRLTNEGGTPPLGDFPSIQYSFSHSEHSKHGSIQRLFAELTVADRQMRQVLAFASALVLGRIW